MTLERHITFCLIGGIRKKTGVKDIIGMVWHPIDLPLKIINFLSLITELKYSHKRGLERQL